MYLGDIELCRQLKEEVSIFNYIGLSLKDINFDKGTVYR